MDKLAEEEEEEALALQKHMAASLEEQDFDAADFEVCLYSLPCELRGLFKKNLNFSLVYIACIASIPALWKLFIHVQECLLCRLQLSIYM